MTDQGGLHKVQQSICVLIRFFGLDKEMYIYQCV